jgi:hypothetical protein
LTINCDDVLADTATDEVFVFDAPLTLSVTVSLTLYVPAAAYVWLGLVAVDVAPSPKFHECVPIVPPLSVDVSVKFAVRPLVVYVKFAVGVPPPLDTVTVEDFELDLPLALSVTVSVTLYEPEAA